MEDLFQSNALEGFKTWLESEDVEIRAYAALCIGNLARKGAFLCFSDLPFFLPFFEKKKKKKKKKQNEKTKRKNKTKKQ